MRFQLFIRCFAAAMLLSLCGCGQSPSSSSSATSGGETATSAAPAPAPKPVVLNAGTAVAVTINQEISSKTANTGDHFDASVAAPIVVNGKQIIPSGARVSGTVTVSKSAGRFQGNADLAVTLDSITLRGQTYPLRTTTYEETTKGRGKRTAIGAGGGAAVGAIIGAIAGGGKGAAIGAGAGAGAGTAGAAFTGNRDITFPVEAKLNFKLIRPIEIARD